MISLNLNTSPNFVLTNGIIPAIYILLCECITNHTIDFPQVKSTKHC